MFHKDPLGRRLPLKQRHHLVRDLHLHPYLTDGVNYFAQRIDEGTWYLESSDRTIGCDRARARIRRWPDELAMDDA
jgi:hypothetical protein